MTYAENVVDVYRRATGDEITEGREWYNNARALALELSPDDVWRGAGVIAAFSPIQQWNINVKNARNAFVTGVATGHTKMMCGQAQRILDGEHALDVLGGQKVRAFASAIADPNTELVTVDRHAHDIAMGRVFGEKERPGIGKRLYNKMSMHYSQAAYEVGETPCNIQAITWVTWRREKGIK